VSGDEVLHALESSGSGLSRAEAQTRLARFGSNAIASHRAEPLRVLWRQLKNPLLLLLAAAAITSFVVGERTNAAIILLIVSLSVGLGFFNEYRSERAVEELHSRIRHLALVSRGGALTRVDVTELVPGDVVQLDVGDIVPADMRLLESHNLECDESVLTGESLPVDKSPAAIAKPDSPLDLPSCLLMGTIVQAGTARGVVVGTGPSTAFGRIAVGLGRGATETSFQVGLRQFSLLLVRVTGLLTVSIFLVNFLLGRPILQAALFSLAIAVGLTPQLLPAIVTVSLSLGARQLMKRDVLVKRLVSIEDFGNVEVLFTDKTGTLTEGQITFSGGVDVSGQPDPSLGQLGLLCNDAAVQDGQVVGGNPLDRALWDSVVPEQAIPRRLDELPFDYDRKLMSVLVEATEGARTMITKGAPETVLRLCGREAAGATSTLGSLFAEGRRVVAVATRVLAAEQEHLAPADEMGMTLRGFLCFTDPPKAGVREALQRLDRLGIEVKLITGDNEIVARKLCQDVGMRVRGALSGLEIDGLDDAELMAALAQTDIFARVTPEQKSRVIRAQRAAGVDVGFLGDGVNDAVALHDADVGISVDTATEVAKDAADIVLLRKDLDVLADGVVEGRRIFANTIKYVLMGTSSNFGNMFSAAGASVFLAFLPMTPTQILLNNLLYDVSELTIPTDRVDEELLRRPAHWDVGFIRRFMIVFGPISSIFDFLTFAVMLFVFHARGSLFQSGWFVESLATQTLVIFVIRTRRVPFLSSRPGRALVVASLVCVAVGALFPFSPLAPLFGFTALPIRFFLILLGMVIIYLGLVEAAKARFFRIPVGDHPLSAVQPAQTKKVRRIRTRWSQGQRG
jgi:Mg2+-importing ATPase